MKENTSRIFWEIDEEKTDEEKLKEQYGQSKMGYLEEKLKNAQFGTLDHIVIDCPDSGIVLDHAGTPINIKIRSSGPYKIELIDS